MRRTRPVASPPDGPVLDLSIVAMGGEGEGIALLPDGSRVYVSNGKDGTVSAIDTASNSVVATVAVGKRPWNMARSGDGSKLYVANGRSASVSVIDTRRMESVKEIPVGSFPWGVAIP